MTQKVARNKESKPVLILRQIWHYGAIAKTEPSRCDFDDLIRLLQSEERRKVEAITVLMEAEACGNPRG